MRSAILTTLLGAIFLIIFQLDIKSFLGNDLFGAILGAYFAFTFFVIGKGLELFFEKKRNNFISIVQIQHLCASILHALAWNIKEIKNLRSSLTTDGIDESKPLNIPYYIMQPRIIEIDKSILLNLKHLNFLQDAFNMILVIEDTNAIMKSTREHNEKFEKNYMGKIVTRSILNERVDLLTEQLKSFDNAVEKAKDVLTKARVLAIKERGWVLLKKTKYSDKEMKLFEKERLEVDKIEFNYEFQDISPKENE